MLITNAEASAYERQLAMESLEVGQELHSSHKHKQQTISITVVFSTKNNKK